jgi:hypothetical protein
MCVHQVRIKGMTQRANFYEELKEVFFITYGFYGLYKNDVGRIECYTGDRRSLQTNTWE